MSKKDVFFNWIYTLIVGGITASIIVQEIAGFAFSVVALILSIPYLIIMLLVSQKLTNFWLFHGVHLLLTCLTAVFVFIIKDSFIGIIWMPFLYFLLSVVLYFVARTKYKVEE